MFKLGSGVGLGLSLGSEVGPGVVAAAVKSGEVFGCCVGRAVNKDSWTRQEVLV